MSRRASLATFAGGLGSLALGNLLNGKAQAAPNQSRFLTGEPKAKRVIYLFQGGGPSQIDLFDHKPRLNQEHGTTLVMVTHDPEIAGHCDEKLTLAGGRIVDA